MQVTVQNFSQNSQVDFVLWQFEVLAVLRFTVVVTETAAAMAVWVFFLPKNFENI